MVSPIVEFQDGDDVIMEESIAKSGEAKGLEFKVVFIVGMSKDEYPFSKSQSGVEMSEDAVEREQRLLYVAMTRARDMLYISYCGEPSKFIPQIEPRLIDSRT
jgi:DNA helicase II / ATP-dependent DNA helicase PcrA